MSALSFDVLPLLLSLSSQTLTTFFPLISSNCLSLSFSPNLPYYYQISILIEQFYFQLSFYGNLTALGHLNIETVREIRDILIPQFKTFRFPEPMMIVGVVLIVALRSIAVAELFTSIAEMELLLEAEKGIPDLLDVYVERFQQRLDEIKQFVLFISI